MGTDHGRIGQEADRAAGLRPQPPAASSLSSIPCAGGLFNMNEYVRVKLTETGLAIMEADHNELAQLVPTIGAFKPPKTDSEGWVRFQLWALMQQFGHHIAMGVKSPFETTILVERSTVKCDSDTHPEGRNREDGSDS